MNRVQRLVGVCGVMAMCCGLAIGQESASKKMAQPAKMEPAAAAKDAQPDMEAMMAACATAAQPGKMHEHLVSKCGIWEGKVKMWMDPSAPPQESTCTTTITPMFGGRFTKGETEGMMNFGGEAMKFEGFGIYGYNNTSEKFESTWCDNMGTMLMNLTGELSSDGKTMTWNTKFMCPMTKQDSWMREIERTTGPDTMVMEMWGPHMDGSGKEVKMMEITYTRKPGSAAKLTAKPETGKTTTTTTTSADK